MAVDSSFQYGGAENDRPARCFDIGLIGKHKGVAVDDPGTRRYQRAQSFQTWLERLQPCGVDQLKVLDPIRFRLLCQLVQIGFLAGVGGHYELAASFVGQALLVAILVEGTTAVHAETSL